LEACAAAPSAEMYIPYGMRQAPQVRPPAFAARKARPMPDGALARVEIEDRLNFKRQCSARRRSKTHASGAR
jgi:hypothetical protein